MAKCTNPRTEGRHHQSEFSRCVLLMDENDNNLPPCFRIRPTKHGYALGSVFTWRSVRVHELQYTGIEGNRD